VRVVQRSEYVQEALLTGCVVYVTHGVEETEIVSRRSFIDDGGARVKQLLFELGARGMNRPDPEGPPG
jgi:hypothetical protein